MIGKILSLFRRDVGAPVHCGANPVYFTSVHEEGMGWLFTWRTSDYSYGAITEHWCQADAIAMRERWESKRETYEHATFVREGSL